MDYGLNGKRALVTGAADGCGKAIALLLAKEGAQVILHDLAMKEELLKHREFENIEDADRQLQEWRKKYNTVRPHESLGMKCPADVYQRSGREYDAKVKKYEYGGQYHVLKVNSWGYVRFHNFQVYLSETMINEHLEFRPNPHGDSFFACYRNYRIAEFDAVTGKLLSRFITKL